MLAGLSLAMAGCVLESEDEPVWADGVALSTADRDGDGSQSDRGQVNDSDSDSDSVEGGTPGQRGLTRAQQKLRQTPASPVALAQIDGRLEVDCASLEGFGVPIDLDFEHGLVSLVLFVVEASWVDSTRFALAIEITGLNGGFSHHGADVINVSDMRVFSTAGNEADVVAEWTMDDTPQASNEVYTVCSQILDNGSPICEERCVSMGPFE